MTGDTPAWLEISSEERSWPFQVQSPAALYGNLGCMQRGTGSKSQFTLSNESEVRSPGETRGILLTLLKEKTIQPVTHQAFLIFFP